MDKIKLQEQIEELKVKLSEMENELNKVEDEKGIGITFEYPIGGTHLIKEWKVDKILHNKDFDYLSNFRYRRTESNAKADFKLQKELMCIGALADQIDPNYKDRINWREDKEFYSIQQDMYTKEFEVHISYPKRRLGVVYMPEDVAEKVCKILNNKEVEL